MRKHRVDTPMTVAELARRLAEYPPNAPIVISVNDYGTPFTVTGYCGSLKIQTIEDDRHPLNGAVWILGERN